MLSVMLNYPDNNFLPGMVMAMMTCHAAVFGVRALQQFNQFIDSYLQFSITLHTAHQAAH
jgi:hypothetical protein